MSKRGRHDLLVPHARNKKRAKADAPPEAREYIADLQDTTVHAFTFLDDARQPYGPNFDKPHDLPNDDMERQMQDLMQRQARIILELLSRTSKAHEALVGKMLARMYASSLDDFKTEYGFDTRPDFGEIFLYYVHMNRPEEVKALMASAYDALGLVKLDEPDGLFHKPAVKRFFLIENYERHWALGVGLACRLAGRNGSVTMLRLLQHLTRGAAQVHGKAIVTADGWSWQPFHFVLGALEMGRIEAARTVQNMFLPAKVLYMSDRPALEKCALEGLARFPDRFDAFVQAGYIRSHFVLDEKYSIEVLAAYIQRPDRTQEELVALFQHWRRTPYIPGADKLREFMGPHRSHWIEAMRFWTRVNSQVPVVVRALAGDNPLTPDTLGTWLELLDAVFEQPRCAQTQAREELIEWATYSGCLHVLGNHGVGFTWDDDVVGKVPLVDANFIGMDYHRYAGLKPFTWSQLAAESEYMFARLGNDWRSSLPTQKVIEARGVQGTPTLAQWQAVEYGYFDMDVILVVTGLLTRHSDVEMAQSCLSVLIGDQDEEEGAYLYDDKDYYDLYMRAWSGVLDVFSDDADTLAELGKHLKRDIAPEVIAHILQRAANLFTYEYPRRLLLFLLSLDLGTADYGNRYAMFYEWVEEAQAQLDEKQGPRERCSVKFFTALLEQERKKR